LPFEGRADASDLPRGCPPVRRTLRSFDQTRRQIGREATVGGEEKDPPSPGCLQGIVPSGGHTGVRRPRDDSHGERKRVRAYEFPRSVRRGVVHHDEFEGSVGLGGKVAPQRWEVRPVEGDDDDGADERGCTGTVGRHERSGVGTGVRLIPPSPSARLSPWGRARPWGRRPLATDRAGPREKRFRRGPTRTGRPLWPTPS
jgi:hypothetical protein